MFMSLIPCGSVRRCKIDACEIGVSGESVTLAAIDQKADLGYRGKIDVKGSDDGEQGESFRLNARGVRLGKGSTEIDNCHLIGAGGRVLRVRDGHQENFINA